MRIIKRLLILCILLNILLVFGNIFNTHWVVNQIDLWIEAPSSQERLIHQEAIGSLPPIAIGKEVKATIEVENLKKH